MVLNITFSTNAIKCVIIKKKKKGRYLGRYFEFLAFQQMAFALHTKISKWHLQTNGNFTFMSHDFFKGSPHTIAQAFIAVQVIT